MAHWVNIIQGDFMRLILITALMCANLFATSSSTKIIYGEDNRVDIQDVRSLMIRELGNSIAARVGNWSVSKEDNLFSYSEVTLLSDRWGAAVCSDEKFASQPTMADCTGFLVGPDLLVTAGHCALDYEGMVENDTSYECSENSWVFDYKMESDGVQTDNLSSENLYKCDKILIGELSEKADYALIKLDRIVKDRTPLKLRSKGKINTKESIFVMGHPSGLPLKFADGAIVKENSQRDYFSTNLDTFGGNSGSPIFNASTLEVEGILVRGRTDYVESEEDGQFCMRVNTCDQDGTNCLETDEDIDGEHVNRVRAIVDHIKTLK